MIEESTKTEDQITSDEFEKLLLWLDPDRNKAGDKYEEVRRNLVDYFRRRGVSDPLSLADIVFIRVARLVSKMVKTFVGQPSYYCLGVARLVLKEYWRRPQEEDLPDNLRPLIDSDTPQYKELLDRALEHCWALLSADERSFLSRYWIETPPVKLSVAREQLSEERAISLNFLRVQAHRLKRKLRLCIETKMT